ncbi:ankyrin repeat domain-containing protein 50-like [Octopus vulgaris]|uniref:Ankyrin repeat domain-containing protein 50-like n=1 Tax=Octopus vulgaris TaxID=6645 RepID=A0AA36F091_OCTVU|nr:ankyrin repeat domain-containing protein 50-like [Octopus vulgaris]
MEFITMDNFQFMEQYIGDVREHKKSIDIGECPLCISCAMLNTDDVQEILQDENAENNQSTLDGKTPLHLVCIPKENSKSFTIIKLLLEKGFDVNARDDKDRTPIYFACMNLNTQLVKILIAAGSLVNTTISSGLTPLKLVCKAAENTLNLNIVPALNIANLLLRAGAQKDDTCLPVAIQYGQYSHVKELLDSGMDVNMLDESGRSPLGTACSIHTVSADVVKLLLSYGANVNIGGAWTKQKPLIFAYAHNSFSKIKILLSYGAYITSEEMTALVSMSVSKSILENPEIVTFHSKELLSCRILLAAGFTPIVHGVLGISHDLTTKINQVQMCSSYQHVAPWFKLLIYPQRSLMDWCRISIRRNLRNCVDDSIEELEIPLELKHFLSLKEFT